MAKYSKTESNKVRLLEEGIEMFSEHGFHGIGLKDILSAVNIPKGSFYHYFESKEDFGAKVIDYYSEMTRQQLSDVFADSDVSGLSALQQFFDKAIQTHLEGGHKRGCLAGNLGAEISDTSEICRKAVERAMKITRDAFAAVIRRGQKDGSVRQDIAPGVLADILLNGFEGALLRMKIEKADKPLKQFRDTMLNKFFVAN
ncbi:MAG TPA: TetR family transcriptional regulator [Gammaproteobacteria bacterium]|nr:TetR family transcriptional regulator [Gammaproteobacteria bacterium]